MPVCLSHLSTFFLSHLYLFSVSHLSWLPHRHSQSRTNNPTPPPKPSLPSPPPLSALSSHANPPRSTTASRSVAHGPNSSIGPPWPDPTHYPKHTQGSERTSVISASTTSPSQPSSSLSLSSPTLSLSLSSSPSSPPGTSSTFSDRPISPSSFLAARSPTARPCSRSRS